MEDVEALSTIVGVLKQLDEEARRRVLASVQAFLGVEPVTTRHATSHGEDSPPRAGSSSFSQDRTISPKEFLRDKLPTTDVERVACLAYYLTHYRNTPHFKTVDISALNVEAAQPKFSNTSVAVDNARARGFLVPAVKGSKQLSSLGESYVELLPDRDTAKNSMQGKKIRRTTRKKPK